MDMKWNNSVKLKICLLALIFCLCLLRYSDSYADQSLNLIKVTYSQSLEYFSIEPVWIHTTLNPSEDKLNKDGFYSGYPSASGSCTLGNKQLVWKYKPFSSSNVMGHCGASNYGGILTVKVDGKIIMDTIPIGGDTSCYGSPINKIVINNYNDLNGDDDNMEAFIYSDPEKVPDSLFINFNDETSVPITIEYIEKHTPSE